MMPIYMDSYPHLRSQVPAGQCYYPSYVGIPPQMTVDQAKFPMMYGPWSDGSNCGHMIPCYACSNHGNVPVYYSLSPPTSHLSSAPLFHSCGPHSVFTLPYHANYQFTPHHSVVQPRYEYDKEAERDYHCCGCPNHTCNQRSGGVKIEEQDPEIVRKNDLLVPINSKNYPYPVTWIPPGYIKKGHDYGKPLKSELEDQKNGSCHTNFREDTKSPEKGPRVWNGWFPLDLNSLKSLMHDEEKERTDNDLTEDTLKQFPCPYPIIWMPSNNGKEEAQKDQKQSNGWFPVDINGLKSLMKDEDEKGSQNQQIEDIKRQFPYPIIWLPSHSEQGETDKKDKTDPNVALKAEEPLSSFKVIPVKSSEIDDSLNKSDDRNNFGDRAETSQAVDNIATQKVNSVKRVKVQKKEDSSDETMKVSDAPPKYAKTVATDNPTGTIMRKQSSPQKTSKLPPVCLRVEPLSKMKIVNGSSRSPSPPGSNKRLLEHAKGSPWPFALSRLRENAQQDTQTQDCFTNNSEDVEPGEMERKVVNIADERNCENKNEEWRTGSQREKPVRLHIDSVEDTFKKFSTEGTERDVYKIEEDERVRDGRDMGEMATENKIPHSAETADHEGLRKIRNLSDVEAAKLIQSAYRGFEVRKMETLKKLKQMAEVREQVAEIRNHIKALESTSDLQKNCREIDVIGEMIMRLLLKLDTVQGLHPSLRDIRKALARELVTLQEKLDLLVTKMPREATKPDVDPKIDTLSGVAMEVMQNKGARIVENSVETSGDDGMNMKEQGQSQLSQNSPTQCQDISEPSLAGKKVHGRCENEIRELFVGSDMDPPVAKLTSNMQLEENPVNGVLDGVKVDKREVEGKSGIHPELEHSVQLPLVTEEKTSSEEIVGALTADLCYKQNGLENKAVVTQASDTIHVGDNLQANELRELPIKLIEENLTVSKLEEVKVTGKGENKIEDGEMEYSMLSDPSSSTTDVDNMVAIEVEADKKTVATKEPEINMLAELPLGTIEDERAVSASEELQTNLPAELPPGVIEDEPAVSAFGELKQIKAKKDDGSCHELPVAASEKLETNLVAELPLGVIEGEPAVSAFGELKQIEAGKDKASCHDKTIDNAITNTTATEAEAENVMLEELPVNAAPEVEETQPFSSVAEEETSDEVAIVEQRDEEMMDVDHAPSLESAVTDFATEESEEKREKIWEPETNRNKEDVLLDSQWEEGKCKIERDKKEDDLRSQFASTKEDVVVATTTSQKHIDENNIVMERDKKLIEENAKLREMLEKLMEAGKEQLTVISDLTGRVKDLEGKLSRSKKHGTRRNRKTATTHSGTNLLKNSKKGQGC